jgi:hypothetical protein
MSGQASDAMQGAAMIIVSAGLLLFALLGFLAARNRRLKQAFAAQNALVDAHASELEQEIVRRQRAECELAGESRILELLVRDTPLEALLDEAARLAEDVAPAARAAI